MASPDNQHCANCIGTLSFPMGIAQVTGPTASLPMKNYTDVKL